ncbi:DUF3080 family protein [Pseudoalteromonas sp. MMG006]|uniref:DUF3080 family protein n=1 Tax=Pseudoalteromonas sp. MMG006 TaxID=2822683 RepID=UPI001B373EC7|nr:DUF3080 family protein [Pseudoalteromonas sp. MMG006]MBQ4799058.1 DUF3080 family protein [Pseudoalteromonas sp. MMG006]
MKHSIKASIFSNDTALVTLLILFSFLLVGCNKAPSDTNKTYVERLSSTLDVAAIEPNLLKQLSLLPPAPLEKNNITLSIVELAGISHCKLNVLISEHNNQLGKTASAAGKFKYQINFIQSAQICLNSLDKNSPIFSKIQKAKTYKQTHLMHYFNTMLFKERELNQTWQLTSTELNKEPAGYSDTLHALKQLVIIKEQISTQQFNSINANAIFSALEQLNKYQFNQALIQSARMQVVLNNSATDFVKTLDLNDLCPEGKHNKKAKIISNVFQKFYLKDIQPYQAQLTGYLEELQPLYKELWFGQSITSESINNLIKPKSNTNLLNLLKSSAKNHVIWWQRFYKTCEISPI